MNILLSVVAGLLLLVGLVSMVTPIPGGTVIVALALTMLICVNAKVQACLLYMRTKSPFVNKIFAFLQKNAGSKIKVIGVALKKTEPKNRA